ncbi:MAG: hypothetical protein NZ749_08235 [bacterium]|nr:hypothetical protein [bacterium]
MLPVMVLSVKILKRVGKDGRIEISGLPFQEGQQVEITIELADRLVDGTLQYPLRHTEPYRFEDALSPIGEEDGEVLRDFA